MNQPKDPILEGKSISGDSTASDLSPTLESVYRTIGTNEEIIDEIGDKFNLAYKKEGCARNGITYLHGAIFAVGSSGQGNLEWREHSASSLRELFHQWKSDGKISSAFNLAFPKKVPNMKTDPDVYRRFKIYYEYFSAICHHDVVGETHSLRQLYSTKTKGSDNHEEIFIKMVNNFLNELNAFLPK